MLGPPDAIIEGVSSIPPPRAAGGVAAVEAGVISGDETRPLPPLMAGDVLEGLEGPVDPAPQAADTVFASSKYPSALKWRTGTVMSGALEALRSRCGGMTEKRSAVDAGGQASSLASGNGEHPGTAS